MSLQPIINQVVTTVQQFMEDRVDFEVQSGTAGTSSAAPTWTVVVTNWKCVIESHNRPLENAARLLADGGGGSSQLPAAYVFTGSIPSVAVTKKMRLRKKLRGVEPERVYAIDRVEYIAGALIQVFATLND